MSHDLDQARKLAERLGYVPQMGPDILVSDSISAERLAELRAKGFNPLFEAQVEAKIVTDPSTGLREYQDGGRSGEFTRTPPSLAGSLSITPVGSRHVGPPTVIEASRTFGARYLINRYALRPGREFVAAALPGAKLDASAEPSFFSSGDLPPLTASGADPSVLAWCSWELRHSAAFSRSKAQLLEIVEASAEGIVDDDLQNEPGRHALAYYIGRVNTWANSVPIDQPSEPSAEELAAWYPEGK
jgi:hypothetical protein